MDEQLNAWALTILDKLQVAIASDAVVVTKLNIQRYDDDYMHGDREGLSLGIMVEPKKAVAADQN